MQSDFSNTFFKQNRVRLRQRIANDYPVVCIANGTLQRTADTTFPFAQESNFWYLTGLDQPDLILVMDQAEEYLILPQQNSVKTIFDGGMDIAAIQERSGITTHYDSVQGWRKLRETVRKTKAFNTVPPELQFEPHSRTYANPAQRYGLEKLRRHVPGCTLHSIASDIAQLRAIKQPVEIAALEKAVRITTDTLDEVRSSTVLASLQTEYSLEAAISNGFRRRGASGHAYTPIVASGQHATTLHYVANNGPLGDQDLIVTDVGAEFEHYAADITRTLTPNQPSRRQQDVLDAVIDIQQRAVKLLKPGTMLRDYEHTVAEYTGDALYTLGLITNARDMHAIRKYFPHSSSHFLGLDVHDVGEYGAPLQASMTLTCEPGIYIPEEGIGVRIEDDILITATGNRNLSAHCSYTAYID